MYLKILATALSAPVAFAALASDTGLSFTPEKISTEIDFGTLSGKAKERVYLPEEKGRKASQLDWKYSNAPIVRVDNISWSWRQYGGQGLAGYEQSRNLD